ncbi:EboA domain-containing protein [Streptomyces sp. NPDC046261]|uniref:EboA domain-containing protein n=1 Tax=Streptomyces sp. NPDC046261 TaxID=3157200 RepID=UPI0033E5D468
MNFGNAAPVALTDLRAELAVRLDPTATAWLDAALAEVAAQPAALHRRFPEAARRCGRTVLRRDHAPAPGGTPPEALSWTLDDAVRTLLLAAVREDGAALAGRAAAVYHGGDAAERRAVLRALGVLDPGDQAVALAADALRTHDDRLVAAALGPYGTRHLDPHTYRHGVLKCLHLAIPLHAVAAPGRRADTELARMARAYARELASAGRPVPADLWLLTRPPHTSGNPCASSTRTST